MNRTLSRVAPIVGLVLLAALAVSLLHPAPAHAAPLQGPSLQLPLPYLAFLYTYDLRGQLSFGTATAFLQLACPLSLAIDVKTIHPNRALRTLQFAYNKLRADVRSRGGNDAPDPEKDQAYRGPVGQGAYHPPTGELGRCFDGARQRTWPSPWVVL